MQTYLNSGVLTGNELHAFLECCDLEARKRGFTCSRDPNIPREEKQIIAHGCLAFCAIPDAALKRNI